MRKTAKRKFHIPFRVGWPNGEKQMYLNFPSSVILDDRTNEHDCMQSTLLTKAEPKKLKQRTKLKRNNQGCDSNNERAVSAKWKWFENSREIKKFNTNGNTHTLEQMSCQQLTTYNMSSY